MNHDHDPSPHYLRVVRALALAAVASGCTGSSSDAATDSGTFADAGAAHDAMIDTGADIDASTDVDASLPFTSGPIVPPELPASLA